MIIKTKKFKIKDRIFSIREYKYGLDHYWELRESVGKRKIISLGTFFAYADVLEILLNIISDKNKTSKKIEKIVEKNNRLKNIE